VRLRPTRLWPGLLLGGVALAAVSTLGAPVCTLQVIPDYTLGVAYRAVLRPSPGCPLGTELRVRKSSTLNVRRAGAPYQPIKPETGAWLLSRTQTTVPSRELWTLYNWRWEVYDSTAYSPRLQKYGRWVAGEVLHAAP
jgi:hypothetical protein